MNLLVFSAQYPLPVSRLRAPTPTLHSVFRVFAVLSLFAILVAPQPALATVVIPVVDADMAQQASVIVIGKIARLKSSWDKNHQQIFTKITLSIEEILKGNLKKRRLTVTQFGGVVNDVEAWIDGNAQFTEGEKVLLFLDRQDNGGLRVLHLYQGKFSIFTDPETGAELAYREAHPEGVRILGEDPISENSSTPEATSAKATLTANGFLPLADLKARIHSALTNPSAEVQPQTPPLVLTSPQTLLPAVREEAPFALLGSPAARWFEGDTNLPINMRVNLSRSPAGAGTAIQAALNTWSGISESSFKFQNAGATSAAGLVYDSVNSIAFGDPRGQITQPTQSTYVNPTTGKPYCSGVLAIGGYFRSGSEADTKTINGQKYYKIIEGDLVFADGWENCHNGFDNSLNVAEVATHELGHVIGLGHSADSTATMYAYAHFDNRGASLRADDIAGLRAIYPGVGSTSSPTASSCTYTLSATSLSVGSSAATKNLPLTASASTCSWTASSNVSWVTITSGTTGTGSKTVTLSITANTSSSARTATITIAGKSVTLTQARATQTSACSFSIPSSPINVSANTTRLNITISASSNTCGWTASSDASWITLTVYSGLPNRGSATGSFLIAANPSTLPRSAIVTIAGKPVTINQGGKP